MSEFGQSMYGSMISLKGEINQEKCEKLTESIIKSIGMEKAYEPAIYNFPLNGKGGKGFTYIQPITESFIAWDVWEDHKGAYLIICSCKDYRLANVIQILRRENIEMESLNNHEMKI